MNRVAAGLLILAALAASCGTEAPAVPERPSPTATVAAPTATGEQHTVTDMTGRSVSVPATVETVAALSPAAADFANALGLRVVGRTTDTAATAAPDAKPIGSAISPDFNAVAALAPDLVLADSGFQSGRTRDFDRFAYPVFMFKAATYSEILDALTEIGEASGHADEAATAREMLESHAKAAIDTAKTRAASGSLPKVLILTGGGRDTFGGSSDTYLGSLVQLLGAVNVLGAVPDGGPIPGFGVIEVSQVATLNPDVVLVLTSGQGGLVAQIMADPLWANTPAVRSKRVLDLDTALFLRAPGPRVGEALDTLLPILWP
jgi:iron complex transport system substrate-binding protein